MCSTLCHVGPTYDTIQPKGDCQCTTPPTIGPFSVFRYFRWKRHSTWLTSFSRTLPALLTRRGAAIEGGNNFCESLLGRCLTTRTHHKGNTELYVIQEVYAILRTPRAVYEDLGATYFDQRDRQALVRREIRRLEALGYRVRVKPTSQVG